MTLQIKMIDFQVSEMKDEFKIQMYGLDEHRKTYSITVNHFNPFVYILVPNIWSKSKTDDFIQHFKDHDDKTIARSSSENIVSYEWVKKKLFMDLMQINIIILYIFRVKICRLFTN